MFLIKIENSLKSIYNSVFNYIIYKRKYNKRKIKMSITNNINNINTLHNLFIYDGVNFPIYITDRSLNILKKDIIEDIELNMGIKYMDETFRNGRVSDIKFTNNINPLDNQVELHINFNLFKLEHIKTQNMDLYTLTSIEFYKGLIDNIFKIIKQYTTQKYKGIEDCKFYRVIFHFNIIDESLSSFDRYYLRDFLYNENFKLDILYFMEKLLKEKNFNIKAGIPSIKFHNI